MIHFFFFLSSVSLALGRLEILSPPSLKDWWDTHFQEKNLSISYYGDIPWGTEIKGRISTVSPLNACSRLALDDETNSSAEIIVVVRGGCQMASKVRNLKPLGAKLLLVIDSKNEETDSSVLIDPRGETEIIHIPSALISKKAGDKLLEALDDSDTDTEPVTGVLDLKIEQSRLVKYHLWLSSSNEQTIPFLKEWKEYADLLSSSTTSEIHYGFIYSNDSSPINKDPDEDNCICGGRYCLPDSMQSYFLSGSEAILENIRQNCVRSVYGVDSWWAYIKRFNMSCLAKKKMRDCSAYTLSEIDVEPASIDACVDLYFGDTSPKECMKSARLEKEAKILVKDDAFIFPSFIINGEAYRGNLYPDQVFEFICHSFITMPTECQDYFNPPAPAPSSEPQPAPTSTPGQNTPDQTTTPLPSPDTKPGEKPQPEPTTNLPEPLESRPPKPTPSETEPPGTPPPQNIPTQTATPPTEPSETKPKENPSTDPTSPDTSTSNSTSTEAQPKPAPSTSSTEPSGTKPEEKPTTSISTENEPPASSNSTTVPSDYPETKPSNSSEDMSSKGPSEVPSEKKPSEDKSPVKGREGSASEIMVSQSKPEGPNDSGYYLIIVAVIISVAAAAAGAYYFKRNKKIAIKQEDEEEEEEEVEKVEKKKQQQIKSPKEEYIVLDDTKTERDEEKGGKEEVNDSNQEL